MTPRNVIARAAFARYNQNMGSDVGWSSTTNYMRGLWLAEADNHIDALDAHGMEIVSKAPADTPDKEPNDGQN